VRRAVAATGVVVLLVLGLLFSVRSGGTAGSRSGRNTTVSAVWRIQEVPSPPGTDLLGVSCPSPTFCVAVGLSTSLGGPFVLS
jgi:hypothetical protein